MEDEARVQSSQTMGTELGHNPQLDSDQRLEAEGNVKHKFGN